MSAILFGIGASLLASTGLATEPATPNSLIVRIAELEIDPAQIDAYKAILGEEQEVSVLVEPGVLMLHSVSINEDPTQIRLLEVYANKEAYEAHIKSPHFVKYKTATEKMVRTLRLVDTTPIRLCAKAGGSASGSFVCF